MLAGLDAGPTIFLAVVMLRVHPLFIFASLIGRNRLGKTDLIRIVCFVRERQLDLINICRSS